MITRTTRACLIAASLCVSSSLTVGAELPRTGASMDDVRKQFGAPAADLGAVGKPAITRWVYENFTVYFEGRRVIQTVETQALHGGSAPASAPPQPVPAAVQPASARAAAPAPAAPPPIFKPEPAPAPAATTAPVTEVPVVQPAPVTPAPVTPPAPSAAAPVSAAPAVTPPPAPLAEPAPASGAAGSGFRFDPATGRLVIDSGDSATEDAGTSDPVPAPASAPAEPVTPAEPVAPAPVAEPAEAPLTPVPAASGTPRTDAPPSTPMEETLEFDPETGTFKPKAG